LSPPALAHDAHSAAGRHEKETAGPATVGMNGTLSTREVCAPHSSTNGLQPSASSVAVVAAFGLVRAVVKSRRSRTTHTWTNI
jgi:hypothetical protein